MYCSNCGTKLKEGDIFCTNCGTNIEANLLAVDSTKSQDISDNNSSENTDTINSSEQVAENSSLDFIGYQLNKHYECEANKESRKNFQLYFPIKTKIAILIVLSVISLIFDFLWSHYDSFEFIKKIECIITNIIFVCIYIPILKHAKEMRNEFGPLDFLESLNYDTDLEEESNLFHVGMYLSLACLILNFFPIFF